MAAPGKPHALRALAAYAAFAGFVGLGALPIVLAAQPANRPFIIRVAASLVLGVALAHLRGIARHAVDAEPPSAFDQALRRRPAETPDIDRRFREMLDDVRFGPASQRYWTRVAWPRLSELAGRLPGRSSLVEPPRSRARQLLGRGPSLAAIRDLVARLERP
ncbi:MAG TPA: hypothetical protein VMS64_07170 [Candidatus Methylomirabilis sp.]|nr:hypothetical protein [Candidatus Methylomirabilis sp.]